MCGTNVTGACSSIAGTDASTGPGGSLREVIAALANPARRVSPSRPLQVMDPGWKAEGEAGVRVVTGWPRRR